MCQFFSLISDGKGKPYYFDSEIRKKIISGELDYETDSHTSIADYCGFTGVKEDNMNKYEYNPLTGKFVIDQMNTKDDSVSIKRYCKELDFKTIVPELIVKPIIHPFKVVRENGVTEKEIELLKEWASMWDSVGDSVRASVWAYISSFFEIKKWKYIDHPGVNPFQSCIDLWESGLVPNFDGTTWRLHAGEKAVVVYELH